MGIRERAKFLQGQLAEKAIACGRRPTDIALVGVSKGHSSEKIREAWDAGISIFGESYVQEFLEKYETLQSMGALPSFHFIGHLQSNKVKYIIDKVELIHSVDRLSLAEEIDRQAGKHGKIMDVLVEINVGEESGKSGISLGEVEPFLRKLSALEHLRVEGFMIIPPPMGENGTNLLFFHEIYQLFVDIGAKKIDNIGMRILSMGMSDDFLEAIEEGSTLVRIGTALFGEREYPLKQSIVKPNLA